MMFTASFCGASCVFLPPRRRLQPQTARSGSLPSSSPMRSSFQVQQSSINLIHSPTPSSGREPAASGPQITGVRPAAPPQQPARRSCCCASVPPCGGPHSFLLPGCSVLRRFIQESCGPMEPRSRGEKRGAGQPGAGPCLINACYSGRGGAEGHHTVGLVITT